MCGICGKVNFDNAQPVDAMLLRRMTNLIAHRGPDGSGEYLSGPVGLGHRRLSIIDLHTGDQPMCNEDGSVWVVYNGEIYNFHELRTELEGRGHRFKSNSDTEVIVHLYEELGDACVTRLRGMFAFALWDEARRRLLLARDRVGVKPLYYADTGRSLLFGSEIKSLLADPQLDRRINPQAVDRFFSYYYVPGEETLLQGVRKLPPGHVLTVDRGKVSVKPYWDLHFEAHEGSMSFPESVASLRQLLRRTVKDHMISDVPVGVLLSGGVDSTGVLSYAAEAADRPLHSFTVGFEGAQFADERPYARMASRRYGTIHHETTMTAGQFRDFLPRYVWHMEEPVCEPPAIALHFVSAIARQTGVKVLLSGEGGDEAFGGYPEYRNLLMLERLKTAAGPFRGLLRAGFGLAGAIGSRRLGRYAPLIDLAPRDYYMSRTATPLTGFNSRRKADLYTPGFASLIRPGSSADTTRALFDSVVDQPLLNRMLYVDTRTWLPDDLLVKADKMTMATSVELRVPLLDHQVLEFAASLPVDYKVKGWQLKRVLKAALEDAVPREIIERKKTGFPVPYDQWMAGELKEFVHDTLLAESAVLNAWFSRAEVARLLRAHQRGEGCSKEVFSLVVFELWHAHFMGNEAFSDYAAAA